MKTIAVLLGALALVSASGCGIFGGNSAALDIPPLVETVKATRVQVNKNTNDNTRQDGLIGANTTANQRQDQEITEIKERLYAPAGGDSRVITGGGSTTNTGGGQRQQQAGGGSQTNNGAPFQFAGYQTPSGSKGTPEGVWQVRAYGNAQIIPPPGGQPNHGTSGSISTANHAWLMANDSDYKKMVDQVAANKTGVTTNTGAIGQLKQDHTDLSKRVDKLWEHAGLDADPEPIEILPLEPAE